MLKLYCIECGNPTSYSASKPKFCSSCGTPFDKLVINKVMLQKPTVDKITPYKKILPRLQKPATAQDEDADLDFDDFENDVNKVPLISKLDVEIEKVNSTAQQKVKIGDIIGSAKNAPKREKIKNKPATAADRKKFLEDFRKEAGSIRHSRGNKDG